MGFLAPAILAGLATLAIPPLVHMLNRKRFDVVDWAAMQFLEVSPRVRKKIFLEQLLLMLLRMSLLLFLVLGVASPWAKAPWLAKIAPGQGRDLVIIVDGSFSMGYQHEGRTAHEAARDWANQLLGKLGPGDAVAVLHARQQPAPIVGFLSSDLASVRRSIADAPGPSGGTNMPAAVREAIALLKGTTRRRDVVILTDGQRHGWADPKTLERWELLAGGTPEADFPDVWVVNVVPKRPAQLPNWSLAPIRSTRAVASVGREVKFKSEVRVHGPDGTRSPGKVRIEVDGRPAGEISPPTVSNQGRVPIVVTQRFATPGSHLVTLIIEDDAMPGDNRQVYAVEVVPTLPVLMVDGDPRGRDRGAEFLRDALAPPLDTTPSFLLRIVPAADLTAELLTRPLARAAHTAPRVLILANVPSLRPEQSRAIEAFLNNGGGVLVTLGRGVDARNYNDEHFREGRGWLPARLVDMVGDENDLTRAVRPVAASLEGPALELFKSEDPGTLAGSAYFPRHWKVETQAEGGGVAVALLGDRTPLFVEKTMGKGRTMLATVPLDNGWRTNLTDLGDFVRLTHELVYFLASARGSEVNLEARQPLVIRPLDDERPGPVSIQPPSGPAKRIVATEWPLLFDETGETGVYRATTDTGKTQYFVVQPDGEESTLARCTDDDRDAVKRLLRTTRDAEEVAEVLAIGPDPEARVELWWIVLLAVLLLLVMEVRMTRKLAGAA